MVFCYLEEKPVQKAIHTILIQINEILGIFVPPVVTIDQDWKHDPTNLKRNETTNFQVALNNEPFALLVDSTGAMRLRKKTLSADNKFLSKLNRQIKKFNFWDFLVRETEVIPETKKLKLITSEGKSGHNKSVGEFAKSLPSHRGVGRKPATLRSWIEIILFFGPDDFIQHYKERKAYNPYVQEWLTMINNYDLDQPLSADRPTIIQEFVANTAPIFNYSIYKKELNGNESTTKPTEECDRAIIRVAQYYPQATAS
jgi:hypothetical protein